MLYIEIIFCSMASKNGLQNKKKGITDCEF